MKYKNCIVTGGAGFIGSYVVERLVKEKCNVTVIDDLSAGDEKRIEHLKDKIEFIKADIRDKDMLQKTCSGKDTIFHFAADPDVKSSVLNPQNSFDINVHGTFLILEYMRRLDVPNIVFASSGGTLYGQVDIFPTPEDIQFRPISAYGASKAFTEVYLSAYTASYGMNAVTLRYANIFGPRSTHGVMFDFYHKLKKNPKKLEILGDGKQVKSYLYIEDCIDGSFFAAKKVEKGLDAFNIGSNSWTTVIEIADIIADELGLKNVKYAFTGGEAGWTGDVFKMLLSTEKIKKLGWTPKVSTEEGIRLYIRWLKENF
ncbi:MAG: SDR family NAD(P)-dependent oxidoreductase [Candidatus Helarchaeota archaeon]|nr:SDR family NAD(P)-dependent oxidoreductase [Candidatus Helarchaeota archaeon]